MNRILRLPVAAAMVLLAAAATRVAGQSGDAAEARTTAVRSLVAMATGDAATMKAVSFNVDPALLDATADFRSSGRELDTAARAKFPRPEQDKPVAPRTADELTSALRSLDVRVNGDAATMPIDPRTPAARTMALRRVDGQWKVDASNLIPRLAADLVGGAIRRLHLSAAINREVAREVAEGKYADWPAAKSSRALRLKAALAADAEREKAEKAAAPGAKP